MDVDRSEPADARVEPNIESVYCTDFNIRGQYQAYCATEASSRPPSPATLTPCPLQEQLTPLSERDVEPELERQNSIAQPRTTNTRHDKDLATLSKWTNKTYEHKFPANDSVTPRHSESGNENHIAQAVTPRGSHPLAASQTLMCHRTRSHPWMQSTQLAQASAAHPLRQKLLPRHVDNAYIDRRPLPLLPVEALVEDNPTRYEALPLNYPFNPEGAPDPAIGQMPGSLSAAADVLNNRPVQPTNGPSEIPPTCNTVRSDTVPHSSSPRKNDTSKERSQHCDINVLDNIASSRAVGYRPRSSRPINEYAQFPSSVELYTPRSLGSGNEDDRRAQRRTQPRDVKLRYQFGQRPPAHLIVATPPPPHRYISESSFGPVSIGSTGKIGYLGYHGLRPPVEPSDSFTEAQLGPRPPPWGSYDNLEMQRRNRGNLREREDARKYRMAVDGGSFISLHKVSGSEDSFGNSPLRREVEEYKEQVLHLYPDLEFDGTAGNGGRACECLPCVIM